MLRREILEALSGPNFRPWTFREAKAHWWPNIIGFGAALLTAGAAYVAVTSLSSGGISGQSYAFIAGPTFASMFVVNQRVRRRRDTPPTWAESFLTWGVLAVAGTSIWWLLARFGVLAA